MNVAIQCWLTCRSFAVAARDRFADEAGEGVISTAIAVLIIALLGAAMWLAFQEIFGGVTDRVGTTVEEIS